MINKEVINKLKSYQEELQVKVWDKESESYKDVKQIIVLPADPITLAPPKIIIYYE